MHPRRDLSLLACSLVSVSVLAAAAPPPPRTPVALSPGPPAPESPVRLTGIVDFEGQQSALLEISQPRGRGPVRPIMRVGDRIEAWEVTSIDAGAAHVKVLQGERNLELTLDLATPGPKRTLHLQGADLTQVLDIYQQISGLTVLRSPGLTGRKVDLQSGPGLSRAEVLAALEGVIAKQGLAIRKQRDKFVLVVSQDFTNRLDSLPECPQDDGTVVFPAGQLKLSDADLFAVLGVYQELCGRTLLRSPDLRSPKVIIRSQTALSRAEAAWALEVLLRLVGVEMVPEGDVFEFVLPITSDQGAGRKTRSGDPAKAMTHEHPLLRDIPQFDPAAYTAKAKVAMEPSLTKVRGEPIEDLLPWYAALVGRLPAAIEVNVPRTRLYLQSQRPLSAGETIYALEALALLNHLRFELSGENEVRLVNAGPPTNRPPAR